VALASEANASQRARMKLLGWQMRIVAGLMLFSVVVLVWLGLRRRAELTTEAALDRVASRHAR
jgi:hypothetical protein